MKCTFFIRSNTCMKPVKWWEDSFNHFQRNRRISFLFTLQQREARGDPSGAGQRLVTLTDLTVGWAKPNTLSLLSHMPEIKSWYCACWLIGLYIFVCLFIHLSWLSFFDRTAGVIEEVWREISLIFNATAPQCYCTWSNVHLLISFIWIIWCNWTVLAYKFRFDPFFIFYRLSEVG